MKTIVKNTLIALIFGFSTTNFGHAFDIDMTVDDEIRKNYNPTKLIQDLGTENSALQKNIESSPKIDENLPALPSITQHENTSKQSDVTGTTITAPIKTIPYKGGNIKVKGGTSFNVTNSNAISDWQRKGTSVRFVSKGITNGKGFTIPASTVFLGEIIESHQPQISCNGGLIVIRVHTMLYKGQSVPICGYVTRANDKKIFFNNIKGERTFLKTMWKKGNWGRTLFNKMLTLTVGLGAEGATFVLSPFPIAYGTICLGANAIASPICAFFTKGGHISIPAGSNFRIKLLDDVMIN